MADVRRRGFKYEETTAELRIECNGTEFMAMNATGIGFFNAAPVAQPSGWAITNYAEDRTIDANGAANTVNSDAIACLVYDLINLGLLTGTVA